MVERAKRTAKLMAGVIAWAGVILSGCAKQAEPMQLLTPTITPTATAAPTPTNSPTPTICPTPTEKPSPVNLDECTEDELWYIENVLQQKYETVVAITMDYAGDLVTFYFGKLGDEWVMIWYCFG